MIKNNGEYMVVTEEQAAVLEKQGVPVDVQYVVKIHYMSKAAKCPRRSSSEREVRYPPDLQLKWAGLKFTGRQGSAHQLAYELLAAHFKTNPGTHSRRALNEVLTKGFKAKGREFHTSTLTQVADQKYLQPAK